MSGLDDPRLAATVPGTDGLDPDDKESEDIVRGAAIGRYMLISPVGTGSMGLVFAAYDPQLDRKVALKLLRPRDRDLGRARERLQREAQALAKLDHPNVVAVYDVGVHEGRLFVAMEFLEGQTLWAWMESAPMLSTDSSSLGDADDPVRLRPWREVLDVFIQAGRGLAAAHEAGLVHRDFKPDNVMLSEGGRVRVMDFGLARVDDVDVTDARRMLDSAVDSLTRTGSVLGTPAYMSLEQFGGGAVDARSDQFAFCVALYEALYGERPFDGETVGELMHALQKGEVRGPLLDAQVPGWLRAVVVRGLAPEPEERFESMRALLDALVADPMARRRRLGMRVGLGLALAAGTWGVLALSDEVARRDAVIEVQATEIEQQATELQVTNAELEQQLAAQARLLSVQRGLRAKTLVGTGNEAEALLLGVQAVGAFATDWPAAPREAVEGLEQVLAHDTVITEADHVLEGHEHYLTHAAYSPDGTKLATSSYDGTARIWDPAGARPLMTLGDHAGEVYTLAFSPDGARLATTSADGNARVWDVASGTLQWTLRGHAAPIVALALSPDGAQLATAALERRARVWDLETGEVRLVLEADREAVVALGYTPDGARLVTAGHDGSARIWSARTGRTLATLAGHEGPIQALAISPDGTQVATGGQDGRAKLWSVETGELMATLTGHTLQVQNLAYSPDGTRLTTVSWDTTGRVYDPRTAQLVSTLERGHGFGVVSLTYSPDSTRVVTGGYGGNIVMWDPDTGERLARLQGHRNDIWHVTFSPDGRQLTSASVDQSVRLWDIRDVRVVSVEGPELDVRSWSYTRDHARLVTLSMDGRLRIWTGDTGELVRTLAPPDREPWDRGTRFAYSPDGEQLAIVSRGQLLVLDPETGTTISTRPIADPQTEAPLRYSPRGELLVLLGSQGIWAYDARTHEPLAKLDGPLRSPALAPDGTHLALISSNDAIQVWDLRTGALEREREMTERVTGLTYSPDGQQLALVSHDGREVELWDARGLTGRIAWPAPLDLKSLAFAPDGAQLVGVSASEGVWIWEPQTGERVRRIDPDRFEPRTMGVTYSSDGSRMGIYGGGLLRTYDSRDGTLLAYIYARSSLLHRAALGPDGTRLTSLNSDHQLQVWDTETGEPLWRERIGITRSGGAIDWPIPLPELTRIGCERLRVFEHTAPKARAICAPLLDDHGR